MWPRGFFHHYDNFQAFDAEELVLRLGATACWLCDLGQVSDFSVLPSFLSMELEYLPDEDTVRASRGIILACADDDIGYWHRGLFQIPGI